MERLIMSGVTDKARRRIFKHWLARIRLEYRLQLSFDSGQFSSGQLLVRLIEVGYQRGAWSLSGARALAKALRLGY
jgi:hypothetical protein